MNGWRSTGHVRVLVGITARLCRELLVVALSARENYELLLPNSGEFDFALGTLQSADVLVLDYACLLRWRQIGPVSGGRGGVVVVAIPEAEAASRLEQGVVGVVADEDGFDELIEAIERAALDGAPAGRARDGIAAGFAVDPSGHASCEPQLTMREWQVVELLDKGLANKDIAAELHIEVATVKNHVHRVLQKLGVVRRLEVPYRIRTMRGGGVQ